MTKPLLLTTLLFLGAAIQAAAQPELAAVKAADDARVAAMLSADGAKLKEVLSDELRYSHSNGVIDTKESLIEILTSGRTKYKQLEYEERDFTFPAPGIALMTGRAHLQVSSAKGEMEAVMAFLAVWRQENGKWRFLAWQSCKLPPATPAAK